MKQITSKKKIEESVSKNNQKSKAREPIVSGLLFFFSFAIIVSLVFYQVYSNAILNELVRESTTLKKQQDSLKCEEIQLNVSLEKKTDLREIERIATEELGMCKIEKTQIEYIQLPVEDKTMVLSKNNEKKSVLTDLVKNFNIFLEYLS